MKYSPFTLTLISSLILVSCHPSSSSWILDSPDHKIRIEIFQQEDDSSKNLFYTISKEINGSMVEVMDPSPLGMVSEESRFVEKLEYVSSERKEQVKESYTLLSGKRVQNDPIYNDLLVTFKNKDHKHLTLNFRAFDNGIAFRYMIRETNEDSIRITEELTGFDFKEGNFWAHPYDTLTKWNPAYETYYDGAMPVGSPAPWNKNGWAFPLLIESGESWMLVSEAGFDGSYGASHLHAICDDGLYRIKFAEEGEAEGYYENSSHSPLPLSTPWRFLAIGSSLHEIVENNLSTDLAAPSKVENSSWIQPGRASWSWWSDNDSPQDYDKLLPFVDFAANMGWEYSLVDANWNRMKNGDIAQLADYARSQNVGLLLWYNSGGKHNIVEEEPRDLMWDKQARRAEFERISKLGIKGIKVDFFQSDKQEIIKQYTGILEDAADFNLLVNFHGCTLPKGWRRTWPNLLTMEAVKGAECYSFDSRFPAKAPGHLAILPYSRNAVGPVDYTPGGFTHSTYPHLTTFGFELALPVVLESGIMHHMDTPEKTLGLPEFAVQFLKDIPVSWDETRYIAGYPGKDAVIARRKGSRWYIGGINGEDIHKELTIDLSLTGAAPESIQLITDASSSSDIRSSIRESQGGKITLHLEPFGGFAGTWE